MRKRTVKLTGAQAKELRSRLRSAETASEYRRLVVLRLSNNGCHIREIARILGASAETIREDLDRFESGGFERLRESARGGSTPTLADLDLQALEEVLVIPPKTLGYLASQWTLGLMKQWLNEHREVKEVDLSTLSRRMRVRGWRRLRPRLAIVRRDPKRDGKLAAIEAEKKAFWHKTQQD